MSINKALDNILEGKLDEMRENFSAALSTKAVEKLEERKIEIAQSYFGQMNEDDMNKFDDDNDPKPKKEKAKKYRLPNGKEIMSVGKPKASGAKLVKEDEQLDEKTIASKKSSKGTKWKVKAKNADDEGSEVEVRQGKRVKDKGDYDRGARAFFMKSGTYENPKDMLRKRK